ncbi:MAG: triose-phosphate isomerase [Desulfoplanes sp.]
MKKIMAANWKMFKTHVQGIETATALVDILRNKLPEDREVLVIPPFTLLHGVHNVLQGEPGFFLGAENFYPADQGAFTGEICPEQLRDLGCTYALAGHSERRHIMGEDDAFVGLKVRFGLKQGLRMILCIGEKIAERKAGNVEDVLFRQLQKGLEGIDPGVDPETLVVAYEPVWAIGTGEVAGLEEILAVHALVRNKLVQMFPDSGKSIPILYGGSVKPDNCTSIISLDNVDGVLVGGASLAAESFSQIVLA